MTRPDPTPPAGALAAEPTPHSLIAAWAVDPELPRLGTIPLRNDGGYYQLRAYAERGQLALTIHVLTDGRMTIELVGSDPLLGRALDGITRVRAAFNNPTETQ